MFSALFFIEVSLFAFFFLWIGGGLIYLFASSKLYLGDCFLLILLIELTTST